MMNRRRFAQVAAGLGASTIGAPAVSRVTAQEENPVGRIAFVKDGDIWMWSSSGGASKIIEDGRAMDPTWEPGTTYLLYVRDGGSYSNLILANTSNGRTRRLTDNESDAEVGSPEYVAGSVWAVDPSWSASGIVCYASTEQNAYGELQMWILDPSAETTYPAAYDGGDGGALEHLSVDADAIYAVYTVLVGGWGPGSSTYVGMRDMNMGTTYPMIEGPQGAYDPAISPDGEWIVASIRDENGVSDLWLCNRADETLTRLTEDAQASNATWSPDGEWIAYLRWEGKGFELRALQVDLDSREVVGRSKKLLDAGEIDSTCGLSWNTL
jgi:WD40 repeat protein